MMPVILQRLTRRKQITNSAPSQLDRVLSIVDLTILGVGSTLGLGIYILAGQVAKGQSGPAVVISFLIAGVASFFAGLCYAEFGAKVPRAGSAYIYSYITVGEIIAFIIGWNLILEYAIGSASVARGYSEYLDSLIDNKMSIWFNKTMHMNINGFAEYPDLFAMGLTLLITVALCIGVKESTRINNVLTCLNLWVVVYVVICGAFKADTYNWRIPKDEIPEGVNGGEGGFNPFGASSMLAGAATCFYGFVGFDAIATAGEEVKNPSKAIPIALIISLGIIFCAYFGVSATITLILPYYAQDEQAPIPYAFQQVGWDVAAWIVYIGALFGLSTSLFGGMFPLPRVMYAMAVDGLIFRFLAKVSERFKTPIIATAVAGTLTAFMATMFEVSELVDMMSIGTLLAYTLVATSVLILRFKPAEHPVKNDEANATSSIASSSPSGGSSDADIVKSKKDEEIHVNIFYLLFNAKRAPEPNDKSYTISVICIGSLFCLLIIFDSLLIFTEDAWNNGELQAIIPLAIIGALLLIDLIILTLQPQDPYITTFKVPFVPFLPAVSMFINLYLMLKLNRATWIRFAVWMSAGFLIYICYGFWNSSEEYRRKGKIPPSERGVNLQPPVINTISEELTKQDISDSKKHNSLSMHSFVPTNVSENETNPHLSSNQQDNYSFVSEKSSKSVINEMKVE